MFLKFHSLSTTILGYIQIMKSLLLNWFIWKNPQTHYMVIDKTIHIYILSHDLFNSSCERNILYFKMNGMVLTYNPFYSSNLIVMSLDLAVNFSNLIEISPYGNIEWGEWQLQRKRMVALKVVSIGLAEVELHKSRITTWNQPNWFLLFRTGDHLSTNWLLYDSYQSIFSSVQLESDGLVRSESWLMDYPFFQF